jgi:predicted metal-dependent hydrolase
VSSITVRKIRFPFDGSWALDGSDDELRAVLPMLGISMTMPYLEPYLIRTMKAALPAIRDAALAEDVRRFSQQEGHHYKNHALFNDTLRTRFDAATGARLRQLEDALEADYQRFSRSRSLRFNVAYAEGFEAMTCAGALATAANGGFHHAQALPGGELWAWHMAEEIEHRTVTFDVFRHLDGSYPYRIVVGTWSQWHFLRYVWRFAGCMAQGVGRRLAVSRTPIERDAFRRYLHTFSPWYDPARIELPDGVAALLARYTTMAEHVRG